MPDKSLADIASRMRGIDIAMLATKSANGDIASRPMSNNGDVDYDGDSYYFTLDSSRMVSDIARDPHVSLAFSRHPGLIESGFYAAVEGRAEVVRDKTRFAEHWVADLDAWFDQGIDTPGLVMLKVHAGRITYWDGYDQGKIDLAS